MKRKSKILGAFLVLAVFLVFVGFRLTNTGQEESASRLNSNQESPASEQVYSLTVNTEPGATDVEIINRDIDYTHGMELKPGKYHLRISKQGYETKEAWISLDDSDRTVSYTLQEKDSSPLERSEVVLISDLEDDRIREVLQKAGIDVEDYSGDEYRRMQKAIQAFQKENDLTRDGKLGPNTWSELKKEAGLSKERETEVSKNPDPSPSSDGIFNEHLVAYYPFDENVKDGSNNNHDGQLHGDIDFSKNGRLNNCIVLDGWQDWIEIEPNFEEYLSDSPYTITAWIKLYEYPEFSSVNSAPAFTMDIHQAPHRLIIRGNGSLKYQTNKSRRNRVVVHSDQLKLNKWYHVAIVQDARFLKFYINGDLVDKKSVNYEDLVPWEGPVYIGGNPRLDRFMTGCIDELRYYDKALNKDQINELI